MALKYHWKAVLDDDTVINQFDGETETPYSEIIDNMSSIKTFEIDEVDGDNVYKVDLDNYTFTFNGEDKTPSGITGSGKATLIFRRRNQVRVDEFGQVITPARTTYIIGFKIDGKSYTADIRAAIGQLEEEVVDPRETNEEPII